MFGESLTFLWIFISIIGILLFLGIIFIIARAVSDNDWRYRTPETKGKAGEQYVTVVIGSTIPNEQYVFNDYVLKIKDDTTQIDHIVVNKRGVFVIETKNYAGRIYGTETQQEWTQVLNYGKTKNRFLNPIKQNVGHINKLKLVLGNVHFRSVVVFVKADIDNVNADNVIPLYRLENVLYSGEEVLTEAQILHINEVLSRRNCREEVTNEEHVNNIRQKQVRVANNTCPYCNKELVLKEGKFGQFLGCPNYPRCKYTKKLGE